MCLSLNMTISGRCLLFTYTVRRCKNYNFLELRGRVVESSAINLSRNQNQLSHAISCMILNSTLAYNVQVQLQVYLLQGRPCFFRRR